MSVLSRHQLTVVLLVLVCVCGGLLQIPHGQTLSWKQTEHSWSWTDCTLPNSPIQFINNTIHFSPVPLQSGEPMKLTFSVHTSEIVTGGFLNLTVRWKPSESIPLLTIVKEHLELCDQLVGMTLSCPVQQGQHNISYSEVVPSMLPKGMYVFDGAVMDQLNRETLCIKGIITIA